MPEAISPVREEPNEFDICISRPRKSAWLLVLTLVLGAFTFGLVGLWGVVEGIMILAGAQYFRQDAKGIPLRD
jgi:hypothetical protein